MKTKIDFKTLILDVLYAIAAGVIVGTAYHFFQNSNGFAPGGVGGLATITAHLLEGKVDWAILMISFNIPIFIPHLGCPNRCVFCNQRTISGVCLFQPEDVREQLKRLRLSVLSMPEKKWAVEEVMPHHFIKWVIFLLHRLSFLI